MTFRTLNSFQIPDLQICRKRHLCSLTLHNLWWFCTQVAGNWNTHYLVLCFYAGSSPHGTWDSEVTLGALSLTVSPDGSVLGLQVAQSQQHSEGPAVLRIKSTSSCSQDMHSSPFSPLPSLWWKFLYITIAQGIVYYTYYIYSFLCLSVVFPTTMQNSEEPVLCFPCPCKPKA